VLRIPWGRVFEERFTLQPRRIGVGIQEFSGEKNTFAVWLSDYLQNKRRLSVKDPQALQALQEKLNQERAALAANPRMQRPLRTSLGLDVIVTGTYER
jgi:hypothetical protein